MAPHTVYLITLPEASEASVVKYLWSHSPKPLTIGKGHYFLSTSHLSSTLQNDAATNTSPFNLATILPGASMALSKSITSLATKIWSFNADIEDQWTTNYAERNSTLLHANTTPTPPFLPNPETPSDPNEEEVEFPLTDSLRAFLADFSAKYAGPVTMFNFLKCHEGTFPRYQLYMNAFLEDLGPKYGVAGRFVGSLMKNEEGEEESEASEKWDMIAGVHYPGAANFGRMLEDEAYKRLDRMYKKGVVKDNPILLMVELEQ
ncbi:hypothetical protein BKA65DRAFT_496099 [Rhexocercosporidium sp. MPI-PUGE-AT-0058]|nr:hypothetical protein BKA65DRAFT_496099 [Rhexocercosporidium sp. MPI-PUGE-AT-0058]